MADNSIITNGIEIFVKTHYYPAQSNPKNNYYFFVYEVKITNNSDFTVKLLKRHWEITDLVGEHRTVDGEGVVGETPIIEPSQSYNYNSGCNFTTDIGKMGGYYTMQNLITNDLFEVKIPDFMLVLPARLN